MEAYRIETNHAGRKVLIIQDYFGSEGINQIATLDFDIIFFDTSHLSYNLVRELLSMTSPLLVKKMFLKPRFMTMLNHTSYDKLRPLIDGFAQSAVEPDVTARSEEIYFQYDNLKIAPINESDTISEKEFFRRVCLYCISREIMDFTASTMPTLRKGVSAAYSAYVNIHKIIGSDNHPDDNNIRDLVSWLLESEFIERKRFIERIHLCPMCNSDHLIFSECCNKCKSSNLKEEDMIHHFRCANISRESEYLYDGELRCPKCKHFLRHIGIDYDRPSRIQTCRECGTTQLHSEMKVTCAKCGHQTQPHLLTPYDIYEYTFTPKGIKAICSGEIC